MVNKIILNLRNAGRDTDIEFPCTEKEMSEALEKIAIPELKAPKVYVSEVVEPSGLSMLEGKTLNLDEVYNNDGQRLSGHGRARRESNKFERRDDRKRRIYEQCV